MISLALRLVTDWRVLVAAALVFLAGATWAQTMRLGHAHALIEQYTADAARNSELLIRVHGIAQEKDGVILGLRGRVASLIEERRADLEARERAIIERDQELAKARAATDKLRRDFRAEFTASQSCETLRTTRLDACGPIAKRLRERSAASPGDHRDSSS